MRNGASLSPLVENWLTFTISSWDTSNALEEVPYMLSRLSDTISILDVADGVPTGLGVLCLKPVPAGVAAGCGVAAACAVAPGVCKGAARLLLV